MKAYDVMLPLLHDDPLSRPHWLFDRPALDRVLGKIAALCHLRDRHSQCPVDLHLKSTARNVKMMVNVSYPKKHCHHDYWWKIEQHTHRFTYYPIHLTLCSDSTRKRSKRTQLSRPWRFCDGVFIHVIKVTFRLACVNTVPITHLRAYITA